MGVAILGGHTSVFLYVQNYLSEQCLGELDAVGKVTEND